VPISLVSHTNHTTICAVLPADSSLGRPLSVRREELITGATAAFCTPARPLTRRVGMLPGFLRAHAPTQCGLACSFPGALWAAVPPCAMFSTAAATFFAVLSSTRLNCDRPRRADGTGGRRAGLAPRSSSPASRMLHSST